MSEKDSSKTRVVPVFEDLFHRDPTGREWLAKLLTLPLGGSESERPSAEELGEIQEGQGLWGENEKALMPPRSLLKWLVRNTELQSGCALESSEKAVAKRCQLIKKDPETIAEAVRKIEQDPLPESAWYILEGFSYPDAFIRTPTSIVVVEGKRTEPKPTRSTKWMSTRDQLLRHIDCAWELSDTESVFGLLIVEGDGGPEAVDVPEKWLKCVRESRSAPVLDDSLPHRSKAERTDMANAVLGVTTWQKLCAEFDISWASLPGYCS